MNRWKWLASILLSFTIAFFIVAVFVHSPEPKNTKNDPGSITTQKEDSNKKEPAEEKDSGTTEPDEVPAGEQEGTLSEGLREVFTSVIESARDMFIREDLDIVAIGDSLTQGVGDSTDNEGYIGILENTFNSNEQRERIDIENYGKRGNRTDQLLERMQAEDLSNSLREADLVLITIGANDVMKVVKNNFTSLNYKDFVSAQKDYEAQLNGIIQRVEHLNPDASIYLVGLYNPFDHYFNNIPELGQIISDYNRISKSVINEYDQATFIPVRDIFTGAETELLWEEDHFHPNERGYKKMAERVLEYIRSDIEE
ncbi:SGNH/GDSL hydrolase family protein [Halobacillus mangrovi]|uniref:SGNH/GDSL hydrolase family protein n=1 Tax=Halobacillus mangrovi TaxID=402384 RepID=UPI003D961C24